MKQQNLRWYWNRLLAMSPQEIVDRSKKSVNTKIWSRRTSWVAPIPDLTGKQDAWELPSVQNADLESQLLLAEANRYLDGQYRLLNIEFEEPKIDWHLDPQSGTRAPLEFGLTLNYRDYALVGNVKNIWEKNRHHHLTVLALASGLTNDDVYAQARFEQQLLDWIEANPFPLGVNWHSSLELGVRLISWIWIERLLRGTAVHQRLFGQAGKMWSAIYWHQWLIAQYYSPGSSANNHLIGEMAGLFIASSVWSVFPESTQWQSLGKNILEREVSRQTFADGLNREQAFSYHVFSLEFFLLAGIEAERIKNPVSSDYRDWVTKMLTAIPPLVDVGGNLPDYGDSDEGMALQLRPLESSRIDWLYRLGRQWLKAPVPLPANGSVATAMMAINAKDEVEGTRELKSTAFEDAGLFVLASNRGQPEEVFCLADAGALGFLSIAAHGHADALSFTLSVGGVPVIVDTGTCTYVGDFPERAYFRSTKAHNTIVIDEVDQSEPAGTFLWRSKAETRVLSWDASIEGGTLLAEHDGYTRLAQGVTHQRQLRLSEKLLEIEDRLQGVGRHTYEWRLHFSPLCKVNLQSNHCFVSWTGGELKIQLDSQMEWSIIRAGEAAGWYSPGFNLKEPIFTLIGKAKMEAPLSLATRLEIN